MYVTECEDGHVEVKYISAHTSHELGTPELPHLPLPKSVKEEIAMKISTGIPPERILEGLHNTHACVMAQP
jgi:hypothetical protein